METSVLAGRAVLTEYLVGASYTEELVETSILAGRAVLTECLKISYLHPLWLKVGVS